MIRMRSAAQHGAALVMAMLTVALVATLAAAGVWMQWRAIEIESIERQRSQAHWLLLGALDWARLILREDARTGGKQNQDHLAEPWAIPLMESRLSTFVGANAEGWTGSEAQLADDVYLSGQISDMQGRLNIKNLTESNGDIHKPTLVLFTRLFEYLGLPLAELQILTRQLSKAQSAEPSARPLMPQRAEQLTWLGISGSTVRALTPHIGLLPVRTLVNLNTATEAVLYASVPGIDISAAQSLIKSRSSRPFEDIEDVRQRLKQPIKNLDSSTHSVNSSYFEVRGRLRWGQLMLEERSLVERNGMNVATLWSDRGQLAAPWIPNMGDQPIK